MSDIEKAMAGDKDAFSRIIVQNKEAMYKTAIVILKNEEDAYDAIQDALIKMYKNIKNLQNPQAFRFWSRRIIVNSCYDIISKNKKVVEITTKLTDNFEETREDIYNCDDEVVKVLEKIDPDLRLTATLYYYDDLSTREIGEIGEKLGTATLTGYDGYTNKNYNVNATLYKLVDYPEKCVIAVQFDEDTDYYVYTNSYYRPETLGDFIEDLKLKDNISFGTIEYSYSDTDSKGKKQYYEVEFYNADKEIIWDMLFRYLYI